MQFMITYGLWLGHQYGLGPSQLGMVALILGLFDLAASVSVSLFTDTFGKRRSVLLGTSGSFVGHLLHPFPEYRPDSGDIGHWYRTWILRVRHRQ